jgi:hypothetical protein
MRVIRRQRLPLVPLLHTYLASGVRPMEELGRLPGLGPRFRAVLAARSQFLNEAFLDTASETILQAALVDFYKQCLLLPLHTGALRRRAGIVRHGLNHLLRCVDPLSRKAQRCLAADGPYHVAGLGPAFWSALVQGLDPARHAGWTPDVVAGLVRLGLANWRPHDDPARVYAAIQEAYARIRERESSLSALHIDHFLSLVAAMPGRDLWSGQVCQEGVTVPCSLTDVLRQERSRVPLRSRLKEQGSTLHKARREVERAMAAQDGARVGAALALVDPEAAGRTRVDWQEHQAALALWVGRLWEADDPYDALETFWRSDPIPGAGSWLPTVVLHLRDARSFHLWNEPIRQGYAVLDDALAFVGSPAERYRLFNEGIDSLCNRYRVHPLEIPSLMAALAGNQENPAPTPTETQFGGFCSDTFHFLRDLAAHNCRDWMEQQRTRYRFAVREPLVELCQTLAKTYFEPILCRERGWRLETAARIGRSLTSICKNDYGRSVPYHTALWITFFRPNGAGNVAEDAGDRAPEHRRDGMQFFVRLDAAGVRYGLRFSPQTSEDANRFQRNLVAYGQLVYRLLSDSGAMEDCGFGDEKNPARIAIAGPEDLRQWAGGKSLMVSKIVPAATPLATASELAGDILLTFDRLLPLYVCAAEADPPACLVRRAGAVPHGSSFASADFCRETFLDPSWLRRALELLDLKRQLILQGVPGTGKTHVAHRLALLLADGQEDRVRLVQFHPAYSYEEFVEGIRVRSVEINGRQDVTYPVEDGLLCAFAAEAAARPQYSHVLIIDELNRGNLPRIFGELLYLLEYRGEGVRLLYSKREFRLPPNLYVIGTMNAADRSVALIDQALRRRFAFLDMQPDAAVLAAWLKAHPPLAGPDFAAQIVALFDRLNLRLRRDLGPQFQIGHSYFMVPSLCESRLRVVWDHHVLPVLEEYFHGHPEQVAAYDLERLLDDRRKAPGGRKRRTVGARGAAH